MNSSLHPSQKSLAQLDKHFFSFLATEDERLFEYTHTPQWSLQLRGTYLYECACVNTHKHDRLKSGNARHIVETTLLNHISDKFNNKSINILSIGAGGLLHELMVIVKLALNKKVFDINLVVQESCNIEASYDDLTQILQRLKQIYPSINITHQWFRNVSEIPSTFQFDIVYSADNDIFDFDSDYSRRQLPQRSRTIEDKSYKATIELLQGMSLLKPHPSSLAIWSQGDNIYCFNNSNLINYKGKIYETLNKLCPSTQDICLFYVNANVNNLLINLEYFIKANKPIIINEDILDENAKIAVKNLLEKFKLNYEILPSQKAELKISKCDGLVLVADYTTFDPLKNETASVPGLNTPNVIVVRHNYLYRVFGYFLYDVIPTIPEAKKNLLMQKTLDRINILSTDPAMKKLLETALPQFKFYNHGFFKTKSLSFAAYITNLANGDLKSQNKADSVLRCLEAKNVQQLKLVLATHRNALDIVHWKTTGMQLLDRFDCENDNNRTFNRL